MRVIIAPDKFKGTMTAPEAARAIRSGWHSVRPGDRLSLLPISDGGDGFGSLLSDLIGARPQRIETLDAAHRPCTVAWYWHAPSETAVVESAAVIGLAMLPERRFHPFDLDTFGLGAVLRAAAQKGARRCIVGIGGSATNDGGFGLAASLGWQFLDRTGQPIKEWTGLERLAQIIEPPQKRLFRGLLVAMDVGNPLLGRRGASRVYGPQKGLRPRDFALSERCLSRLAAVLRRETGQDLARVPGAGAAGGLGFGLMGFLGAKPVRGFDLLARYARLEQRIRTADCVITGEGAIDPSTLMGKGVGRLAELCAKWNKPCFALGGRLELKPRQSLAFAGLYALTDFASVEEAKACPQAYLAQAAAICARNVQSVFAKEKERVFAAR